MKFSKQFLILQSVKRKDISAYSALYFVYTYK